MRLDEQWALLGVAPTDDKREVKRAYSRVLKTIDVDADPAAFVRLREAMEAALQWGTARPWWEEPEPPPEQAGAPGEMAAGDEAPVEPPGFEEGEEEDWERWRPPRPDFGEGRLDKRVGQLDALLFGSDLPDPARVRALGEEILADPELAHVDRAAAIESWLAEAIASAFPKSDPLVPLAMARFGWDRAAAGWRRDWNVERIVQRQEDLRFLAACGRPGHPHQQALAELRGPPRRRLEATRLGLAREVAEFLKLVDQHRHSLSEDLDRDSVAWWRNYLAGPHLPPLFWLWMGTVPLVLTFAALPVFTARQAQAPSFWLLLPAMAAVTFGAIFLWSRFAAASRRRAEESWAEEGRKGVEPYLAGAFLLPFAAAFLPGGAASIAASSLLALYLGQAAFRRSWTAPEWTGESSRPRIFLPAVAGAAALFALLSLPVATALKLALPLALLCWLGSQCYHPMRARLPTLARGRRLGLLAAGLAFAGAVLGALMFVDWPLPAWALALVPAAIVAAHLAAAAALVDIHAFEWPLRVAVIIVYFVAPAFWPPGFAGTALAALGLYGLTYASVRLALAIRDELRSAAPQG